MTEKLRIKITQGTVDRVTESDKRQKATGDYSVTGWQMLGVPFGGPHKGRDLDGEAFHEGTDIWVKVGDAVNLTYYHGFGPDAPDTMQDIPALIGKAIYTHVDDRGHWFDVLLDTDEPLVKRLTDAGIDGIRASSGAVSHLVRMGKGGLIDNWPIGEMALFDVNDWRLPANDFAVIEAKAAAIPEVFSEAGEVVLEAVKSAVVTELSENLEQLPEEVEAMADEVETTETPVETVPLADYEALKADVEALKKAAPGKELGAPVVTKNAKESPSFIKALSAWAQGDNPAGFGKRNEITMHPESAKGAWEGGTDNEGGYAVPDDFYNSIVEQRTEASFIRKAPVQRFVVNHDRLLIPTEATAGTKLVVTDEEAAYDENEPVFGQVAATVYKFTKMLKVSEELMDGDAVGLEAYLASIIARSSAAAENYYCTVGTGVGMPLGVLAGATASGITTANATAITAGEVSQVVGTLDSSYINSGTSGFLMTGAVKWYLRGLTGNPFQFVQTPAGGDFFGYPAYISPDMQGLVATEKSLLFGDFQMYGFVERQGVVLMRNPYLYQANGIVGLFVKQRFGGVVLQTTAFKYLTQKA